MDRCLGDLLAASPSVAIAGSASALIGAGVNTLRIAKQLGHTSPRTTDGAPAIETFLKR